MEHIPRNANEIIVYGQSWYWMHDINNINDIIIFSPNRKKYFVNSAELNCSIKFDDFVDPLCLLVQYYIEDKILKIDLNKPDTSIEIGKIYIPKKNINYYYEVATNIGRFAPIGYLNQHFSNCLPVIPVKQWNVNINRRRLIRDRRLYKIIAGEYITTIYFGGHNSQIWSDYFRLAQ